jgi:conjugative transfer signal peptidase TraF
MKTVQTSRGSVLVATIASMAVCASLLPPFLNSPHRLFFNPSPSAPKGWYWLASSPAFELGSFAVSLLPAPAAALADNRHYIPRTIPVLKKIAAASGDRVCESAGRVIINGRFMARAVTRDGESRNLTPWEGCRTLAPGEYFLLNTGSPQSFDSRYFGPVSEPMLIGTALPLWTW